MRSMKLKHKEKADWRIDMNKIGKYWNGIMLEVLRIREHV